MGLQDLVDDSTHHPEPRVLSGFVMGVLASESSFSITAVEREDYKHNLSVKCTASISIVEDDLFMVEIVQEETGVGHIRSKELDDPNHSNQKEWNCQSIRDSYTLSKHIQKTVEEGSPFEHTVKYEHFKTWSEAVEIIINNEHKTIEGIERVLDLREKITVHPSAHSTSYYKEVLR